jgi:putative hemolysin
VKTTLLCVTLYSCAFAAFAQSRDMLNMANPASTNCAANHNGNLYLQTDSKSGGQYGICQISKTEAYEEWCLYRNDMNIDKKDCPNLIILLKDQ